MKTTIAASAIVMLALGCSRVGNPTRHDALAVTFNIIASKQAGLNYDVTITGPGMSQIGPERYAGGQTISIYVPEGLNRVFRFERYDSSGVLSDTGTTVTDIMTGMNSVTVTLVSVTASAGTQVKDTTVTLGSRSNVAHGSSLDADEMRVYMVSEVSPSVEASIDVWFSNTNAGEAVLYSPSSAANAAFPPINWATTATTLFEKTTYSFSSITTQEEVEALWNGSAATGSLTIQAGDVVVMKTSEGRTVLLSIVSADNSDFGTAVITGKK